jgi:hypothetical protein
VGTLDDVGHAAHQRIPLGPLELAIAGVIAADCLLVNAVAVDNVPPLSLHSLGPLALAFHDKQPHFGFAAVLVFVALLSTWLPRLGRAAALVFVGAALANFLSPAIWNGGAPDYVVFRRVDIIANVSDLLMMTSGAVVLASMIAVLADRLRTSRHA